MIRELTEAEAWRKIIANEYDEVVQGHHGFLCNRVNTLGRQRHITGETWQSMLDRIRLFVPEGRPLNECYWSRADGDDLYERVLAACLCLAMCEAGEATA